MQKKDPMEKLLKHAIEGHDVDPEREAEVQKFREEDAEMKRFFLIFDALLLRGVDPGQAARAAALLTVGSPLKGE